MKLKVPPLYELILTLAVFFGGLAFVGFAKPDAGTTTAIIALITGLVGSFIRGMSPGGTSTTTTTPSVPVTVPTPEAK